MRVHDVWVAAVDLFLSIPANCRWRRANGPAMATVATLFDLDWIPTSPCEWQDEYGTPLYVETPSFRLYLRRALQATCADAVWGKAAEHYLGAGVQEGVGFSVPRAMARQFGRNLDYESQAILRNTLVGGF
eukprot:1401592-Pyramimonas_sp.AAC.1